MKEARVSRVLDMTTGSPTRLLLRFAIPLFLGNLLQQLYNLADTSIAGHLLGDQALSEIGATSALFTLLINFAFGLNKGFSLIVSQHFGARREKEMRKSVCWMTILSLSASVVMAVLFLLTLDPMMAFLQTPEAIIEGAKEYLFVILAGIPLMMAYNLEASLLQAVGNSTTPLVLLLISSILNVVLDFLFMGPLGMGVRGAAIATVLSQGLCVILGFIHIIRHQPELCFRREDISPDFRFAANMLWTGICMGLMTAIYNIGGVVLQGSINSLGSSYIAAQVGSRRLAEFFYIPGTALGTGIATYSSQNLGAGRSDRVLSGIRTALLIYGVWWLISLLITFTSADRIVWLITGSSDEAVLSGAQLYLRINIPMMPPMIILVILRNALQGMGHPLVPLICSTAELIGKVIFALWIVPAMGYLAVCLCEPVTWVICCIIITVWTIAHRSLFRSKTAS